MKILFNDIIQYSDAPKELKSPALSDTYETDEPIIINFDKPYPINSIGIGNYNNNELIAEFDNGIQFVIDYNKSGLYVMEKTILTSRIKLLTKKIIGNFSIGRIAAGIACNIPTSITKEPSLISTSAPRVTLSGQVISGAGGYNYKTISLDSRYKITKEIMQEIEDGYKYIGMGYPFFIDLKDESYKLLFDKLYANERNQRSMTFQSGIHKFLYSRRFEFEERF